MGVVAPEWNPSTWEVELRGLKIQDQTNLQSKFESSLDTWNSISKIQQKFSKLKQNLRGSILGCFKSLHISIILNIKVGTKNICFDMNAPALHVLWDYICSFLYIGFVAC